MRSVWIGLFLLLASVPAFAQTCAMPPDVTKITVVGSDRGVLGFPVTAKLTTFRVVPGAMTIRTTGAEDWPAVSIDGGEPSQSATMWIALCIMGQWYATGAERLRPGQLNGTKPEAEQPGELATLVGTGWLGDPSRWRPMAGYNPATGETVGIMLAAGSTRSDNNTPVHARTQWHFYAWPDGATVWEEGDSGTPAQPPAPPPGTPPAQPPTNTGAGLDLSGLTAKIAALEEHNEQRYQDLSNQIKEVKTITQQEHAAIREDVNKPGWFKNLGGFLTSPTGVTLVSTLTGIVTYFITHAPAQAAQTPSTAPAASSALTVGMTLSLQH